MNRWAEASERKTSRQSKEMVKEMMQALAGGLPQPMQISLMCVIAQPKREWAPGKEAKNACEKPSSMLEQEVL